MFEYVRELIEDNYENVTDVSFHEFMQGMTPIVFTAEASNEEAKQRSQTYKHIEEASQRMADAQTKSEPMQPAWGQQLYSDLLKYAPASERLRLEKAGFALLYSREANAWSIKHPRGDIITVDVVLSPLLSYLNQAALLCNQRARLNQEISSGWIDGVFLRHFLFFADDFPLNLLPNPRASDYAGIFILGRLTNAQLTFLIAHEMGHTVLGHNTNNFRKLRARPGFNDENANRVFHYDRNHEMEFEADHYAARACLRCFVKNALKDFKDSKDSKDSKGLKGFNEALLLGFDRLHTSIELLFIFMAAIEEARANIVRLTGHPPLESIESHPSALSRLNHFRQTTRNTQLKGEGRALIELVEDLLLSFWPGWIRSFERNRFTQVVDWLKGLKDE